MDRASITRAGPADRGRIIGLLTSCGLSSHDILAVNSTYLIATGGALVGVCGLERSGSSGLLRSLAVDPDRRGSRLGRRLLQGVEMEARAFGIRRLYAFSKDAAGFFRKHGWRWRI